MDLALASTLLAAVALATGEGPRLDVSPGLWETTTTTATKVQGDLPVPDTSTLTPEQRARLAAAREQLTTGKPHTVVHQSCVTKEDLDKGLGFGEGMDKESECQRRYLDRTSKHVRVEMTCSPKSTHMTLQGTWDATVKSPDLVVMHGEMSTKSAGHSSATQMDMTARRLGASCGDIKPGTSKAISE